MDKDKLSLLSSLSKEELFNLFSTFVESQNAVQNTDSETVDFANQAKEMWHKLSNEADLRALINTVSVKVFGKFQYTEAQFGHCFNINHSRYTTFEIPKKKPGEYRTIKAPNPTLMGMQQCLNYVFQQLYQPIECATGFVPGRSIVDGARVHLSQKYVYNIDLKDFFTSVTAQRLVNRLQIEPFGLSEDMAQLVANLCCDKTKYDKFVLPQGAPTSPTITNFICDSLDRKLIKLAAAHNLRYSRYADDITFSGMQNVFAANGRFCKSLRHIIEREERFTINPAKNASLSSRNAARSNRHNCKPKTECFASLYQTVTCAVKQLGEKRIRHSASRILETL
ncbi:MAG: RNA-directed DNA polymerase [Salinivirgaceae bacterium]|nr:RNA-directed DNA polymerase [Salinivirgaceae bacterium]